MNPRKQKALTALLTFSTHREAARACGISDRQLRTYLRDPEFKKEYQQRLDLILEEATTQARRAMTPAVTALVEIVQDSTKSDTARILASRAILDAGLRMIDTTDTAERLSALEEITKDKQYEY